MLKFRYVGNVATYNGQTKIEFEDEIQGAHKKHIRILFSKSRTDLIQPALDRKASVASTKIFPVISGSYNAMKSKTYAD